jgi:hypothetical protein
MEFIMMLWPYFGNISEIAFILMLVSTAAVRITPTKADDEKVDMINSKLHKFLGWLPTLGRNPRTKAVEALYLKYKEQLESQKSDEAEIEDQLKK